MAQSQADRFVREVTNALVSLGYHVQQETHVGGTRFDILCELKTPATRPLSVAVECKFRSSAKVPKDQVSKFVADLAASGQGFDRAIMVTNQEFTAAGYDVASVNPRLELTTFQQLYDELFSPRKLLLAIVEDYEGSDLFGGYVPLTGSLMTAAAGSVTAGVGEEAKPYSSPSGRGLPVMSYISTIAIPRDLLRWPPVEVNRPTIPPASLHSKEPSVVSGTRPYQLRRVPDPTRSAYAPHQLVPSGIRSDALGLLTDLLSANEPTLAVVLADFGAGKSTLLDRFRYQLAKRALSDTEDVSFRIPLLFKLRTRATASSFDAFVVRTAFEQLGVDLTVEAFWKQLQAGRFVCLLDGFDEMASRADTHTRHELMRELSPLTEGGGLSVLSCRPSYFVEPDEFENFIQSIRTKWQGGLGIHELKTTRGQSVRQKKGASLRAALRDKNVDAPYADTSLGTVVTIELAKWSVPEIIEFIDRNHAKLLQRKRISAKDVWTFLSNVYDLRDLVERPILLKMVMETVDHGAIDLEDESIDIGASQLYEEYTRVKLERDWLKGETRREVLTPDQRRKVAVQLAIHVFEAGEQEISIDSVREALVEVAGFDTDFLRVLEDNSEEVVLTDVCTCAFITRTVGNSSFRFVHKSFAEFFVASEIGDDLKRSTHQQLPLGPGVTRPTARGRISTTKYSPEILYFLGGLAMSDDQIRNILRGLMSIEPGATVTDLRFNVLNSLFSSGPVLKGLKVADVELAALRVRRTSVRKSYLKDVVFRASKLDQVEFRDSVLDLVFDRCHLSNLVHRKCPGASLRLVACDGKRIRLDGERLSAA